MLRSIIFDMDGTLFQTDTILELALDETFEHLCSMNKWEGATPIDKYREIMGVPLPKVWETKRYCPINLAKKEDTQINIS